ncbi:MAG: ParB/RepB/Spo0J family partition protein [Candidatus Saccharibacteria bacterium]
MSARKGGLGRGFESLIPTDLLDESFDPTAKQDEKISELRNIKLSEIEADIDQPRRHFDEQALQELADSVKEHGIVQPIIVMPSKGGYQIVAGERRWRAAKLAGLDKVPALVRTLNNQHKLEISLIENIQRRDLNALETATAYLKLRDQFNLTLDEIGQRVGGKSVSSISNTLRLLRLPAVVKKALLDGSLREGQARPLIDVDEKIIQKIFPQLLREEWSARKIEQFISELKKNGSVPTVTSASRANTPAVYQENIKKLTQRFSTDVRIKVGQRGAGQIVIPFKNAEQFERIQKLLEK